MVEIEQTGCRESQRMTPEEYRAFGVTPAVGTDLNYTRRWGMSKVLDETQPNHLVGGPGSSTI